MLGHLLGPVLGGLLGAHLAAARTAAAAGTATPAKAALSAKVLGANGLHFAAKIEPKWLRCELLVRLIHNGHN